MNKLEHLKIPLEAIKSATNNFDDGNCIGEGGFARVYKGLELNHSKGHSSVVAIKRLNSTDDQEAQHEQFLTEIQMLAGREHENIVTLLGFCDEGGEKILVYEYEVHGSLDKHLSSTCNLTWVQRLMIAVTAARGLQYLHNCIGPHHRIIHRDIKSSNILLDGNLDAKISDFGLSKIGLANQPITLIVGTSCAGTFGYIDPQYLKTGVLTKESDVYSFGVVLFELLSGRRAIAWYEAKGQFLAHWARDCFERKSLHEIIDPNICDQMDQRSLDKFSKIAYRSVERDRQKRPTIDVVLKELRDALVIEVPDIVLPSVTRQIPSILSRGSGNQRKGMPYSTKAPNQIPYNYNRQVYQRLSQLKLERVHREISKRE